jgi:hypothetical protein
MAKNGALPKWLERVDSGPWSFSVGTQIFIAVSFLDQWDAADHQRAPRHGTSTLK